MLLVYSHDLKTTLQITTQISTKSYTNDTNILLHSHTHASSIPKTAQFWKQYIQTVSDFSRGSVTESFTLPEI